MKRNAEFIGKEYSFNYKIDAIEKFLDDVKEKNYKWAIAYLTPMVEDAKKLDFNDYNAKQFDHDARLVIQMRENLDSLVYKEQHNNFEAKYKEEFDKESNKIYALDEYSGLLFLCSSPVHLKRLVENDERVRDSANALIKLLKESDKDDKLIRAAHKPEFDAIKNLREALKERKEKIKAQKESNRAFAKKFGKDAFKFDLEKVAEGKVEEVAEEFSKIERIFLRYEIYSRTTEYVGKLIDMINIHFGDNGSLNGIVIGESGRKAKVNTIVAGGYNIQCLHYRVLVNPIN